MIFRKTTEADLAAVVQIFEDARRGMHKAGIPQWMDGYPAEADIRADIENGYSYVLCEDDRIVATAAVLLSGEPTYTVIRDGAWLTDSADDNNTSYVAVHRVATAADVRGRGLASAILQNAADIGRNHGKISLRIDTHEMNLPMQRMLARNGLRYCGVITLQNGDLRNAYEKLLTE